MPNTRRHLPRSVVNLRFTLTPPETIISPIRTGPAGLIGFSPLHGVLLATDPCDANGTIETRIAWASLDPAERTLVFPMLCALYGEPVARAAGLRHDTTVTRVSGRRVRLAVHRLLAHIAAMDRDPSAAEFQVVWAAEALLLAQAVDPRVPLASAIEAWEHDLKGRGNAYIPDELMSLIAAPADSTPEVGRAEVNDELEALRTALLADHADRVREWCRDAKPARTGVQRPVEEAIKAAMLALRLERFAAHDSAAEWWDTAGSWWARCGDHRRAELAAQLASSRRDAVVTTPALGEVAGIAFGTEHHSGDAPEGERSAPSWQPGGTTFIEREGVLMAL